MPGVELVVVPLLEYLIQQFCEAIIQARDKTKKFDVVLTSLESTVNSVTPKIDEISKMDQQHEDYPKQEIIVFRKQLEKGKELVDTCAEIPRWNKYKKHKYAKRLADMDSSLRKLLEVQFQAEQLLFIKKMLSEMAAINNKLDRTDIQKPAGVATEECGGGGELANAAINNKLDRTDIQKPAGVATEECGGGGELENPEAAEQSSDDQMAGRPPRHEIRFRRKKEKGETDIKFRF